MGKIILIVLLIIAISAGSFAQDVDTLSADKNAKHDYYVMQGEYMIHYYIDIKYDTLVNDLSLQKNTITSKAELVDNKNGKIKIYLLEGQCVDSKGNIADCNKLRKRLGDKTE